MVKEDHTHSKLFQPDDGANEPRCIHRSERRKPTDEKKIWVRLFTNNNNSPNESVNVSGKTVKSSQLPQRMDHSQVTIQADTAQEANTNVDVLIKQEATELTQPFPVTPVIILRQHNRQDSIEVQDTATCG